MNLARTAAASGIGCCLLLTALIISCFLNSERHGIAITQHFHLGLFGGCVWFYNDEWPYRGGVIQLDNYPPLLQKSGLDFPGVYYRYFRFPTETIWTLRASLWYPIGLFAILPAIWIWHRRRVPDEKKPDWME